jgi:hypothetical protein
LNFSTAIYPSTFKEIKTKNYWINNNLKICNCLTVLLGLKTETGYFSIKNIWYFPWNQCQYMEIDEYIDIKKNQRQLMIPEMFEQRQLWEIKKKIL